MGKILYGEDVRVRVTQGGDLVVFQNIRNFTWTPKGKITREQLIGQTTPRIDDIFDGVAGEFEFVPEDSTHLDLLNAIIDRQTNRVPDTVFDIVILYAYADSASRLITFTDVAFGDNPNAGPSREVHVNGKINWETGNRPLILPV